jgi:hypothetical protein
VRRGVGFRIHFTSGAKPNPLQKHYWHLNRGRSRRRFNAALRLSTFSTAVQEGRRAYMAAHGFFLSGGALKKKKRVSSGWDDTQYGKYWEMKYRRE